MEAALGGFVFSAILFFIFFLIAVVIMRWAFRINDMVSRLDNVIIRLDRISTILGEAYPVKRPPSPPGPPEIVKFTPGEPYVPAAHRFPSQE